jgi:hypothetical protein
VQGLSQLGRNVITDEPNDRVAGKVVMPVRVGHFYAKTVDIPWGITVGNDLRHPQVESPRPPMRRFINWYIGKLHRAATRDSALATAFLKVANLTMPPLSLLNPTIAWRVWRGNRRESLADKSRIPAVT